MTILPPKLPGSRAVGAARKRRWSIIARAAALIFNLLRTSREDDGWVIATGLIGGVIVLIWLVMKCLPGRRAPANLQSALERAGYPAGVV